MVHSGWLTDRLTAAASQAASAATPNWKWEANVHLNRQASHPGQLRWLTDLSPAQVALINSYPAWPNAHEIALAAAQRYRIDQAA